MLECVINISEGQNISSLQQIAAAGGNSICDIHKDSLHNRSVFTLLGSDIFENAKNITKKAVELLDITTHAGLHPRFGVVDVVPFVPFTPGELKPQSLREAIDCRNSFVEWAKCNLELPCITYEPERSLPETRKILTRSISDLRPHPTAGITCVGARQLLVAYNIYIGKGSGAKAKEIAALIRCASIRSLGFSLDGEGQVSCNLINLSDAGPQEVYNLVSKYTQITRTELVGLAPMALLDKPYDKESLDLAYEKSLEYRLTLTAKERSQLITSLLEKKELSHTTERLPLT